MEMSHLLVKEPMLIEVSLAVAYLIGKKMCVCVLELAEVNFVSWTAVKLLGVGRAFC